MIDVYDISKHDQTIKSSANETFAVGFLLLASASEKQKHPDWQTSLIIKSYMIKHWDANKDWFCSSLRTLLWKEKPSLGASEQSQDSLPLTTFRASKFSITHWTLCGKAMKEGHACYFVNELFLWAITCFSGGRTALLETSSLYWRKPYRKSKALPWHFTSAALLHSEIELLTAPNIFNHNFMCIDVCCTFFGRLGVSGHPYAEMRHC